MRSLFLIVSANRNLDSIVRELSNWAPMMAPAGDTGCRFRFDDGSGYFAVEEYTIEEIGLDESEICSLPISEPRFFSLEFGNLTWIPEALAAVADHPETWIENDYWRIEGNLFARTLKLIPQWDFWGSYVPPVT